ncbi:aminoacyl-tRNA hydrolase [Sediminivirga luteola]|uniref:Peptidyl-tRNA hydrolase n=2 Tax=Sediminivirga luteola TaxID=1774748 RepID=A0A8J2XL19_9MICO|nr:peptidyl-tRNA hydrolase [Sediminivirga luteola]
MLVDELAGRTGTTLARAKARAVAGTTRLGVLPGGRPGPRVVLAKPLSYMNLSGGPVSQLAAFYSVPPERVVAVHDDVDLPFGAIKLKIGGGEGGHNGLRDITKALGTKDYLRLRLGVGRPPGRQDTADFVLKPFSAAERKELPVFLADAADAAELLVTEGLLAAQQRYHGR